MATYREYYFKLKNHGDKKHFTESVIFSLLMDVSSYDKTSLTIHFDEDVKNEEKLKENIRKIEVGIPYQYVLGYTEFLGEKFYVSRDVLIPRQETEELVLKTLDITQKIFKNKIISILDMCSGSGVIGIYLAKHIKSNVDLADISKTANEVAKNNAYLHKTNVNVYESDLFNNLPQKKYDVIVSNPPYIKNEKTVDEDTLKYEPHLALFASPQTKFYEEIFKQHGTYFGDEFLLAFEIDEDMEESLTSLIKNYFDDSVSFEFQYDMYNKLRYLFIFKEQHE